MGTGDYKRGKYGCDRHNLYWDSKELYNLHLQISHGEGIKNFREADSYKSPFSWPWKRKDKNNAK